MGCIHIYIYIAYKLVYDIWPCPKTWGIPPKTASLRKWCQTRDIKWYRSWRIHDHPPFFEQRIQLLTTAKNGKKLQKKGETARSFWHGRSEYGSETKRNGWCRTSSRPGPRDVRHAKRMEFRWPTVNTLKWCEKSWEPGNYEETIIHKASWKHWTLFSRRYYTNIYKQSNKLWGPCSQCLWWIWANDGKRGFVTVYSSIDHLLNVGFIYHKIGFKQRPTIGILAHHKKNLDPPGKMWLRKTLVP